MEIEAPYSPCSFQTDLRPLLDTASKWLFRQFVLHATSFYSCLNFLQSQIILYSFVFSRKAFCGSYSTDGREFLSACQDTYIRAYDCSRGGFREFKAIRARDVGWAVLDTAFSPDGECCFLHWDVICFGLKFPETIYRHKGVKMNI